MSGSGGGGENLRKLRYKNAAQSPDELRRRREEEGVQLRKQKREEQLAKKRNVNMPDLADDSSMTVSN
jgi:importin subunit alpha-2